MCLHGRAIDEYLSRRAACACQGLEEIDPDALGGPTDIAIVERLARSIVGGSIDPPSARLQDMDDAADHPTVIDTRLAARVRRQMRCDPRELLLSQPEAIPIHVSFLPEAVNHTPRLAPITLWVRTLT